MSFYSTAAAAAAAAEEDVTGVRARSVALHSDRTGSRADVPWAINESDRYSSHASIFFPIDFPVFISLWPWKSLNETVERFFFFVTFKYSARFFKIFIPLLFPFVREISVDRFFFFFLNHILPPHHYVIYHVLKLVYYSQHFPLRDYKINLKRSFRFRNNVLYAFSCDWNIFRKTRAFFHWKRSDVVCYNNYVSDTAVFRCKSFRVLRVISCKTNANTPRARQFPDKAQNGCTPPTCGLNALPLGQLRSRVNLLIIRVSKS